MANEKEVIQNGLNAAKANAENNEEQQQVEQLSSEVKNSSTNENREETRNFPVL